MSAYVWAGLAPRTTATANDDPLCLAILVNMDVTEIVKYPVAERTPALLRLHKTYPSCHIFWSAVLDSESDAEIKDLKWFERVGLRWCPRSFVKLRGIETSRHRWRLIDINERQGVATPMRLRLNYPGILYGAKVLDPSGSGNKLWVHDTTSQRTYSVYLITDRAQYEALLQNSSLSKEVGVILPRIPSRDGYGDPVMMSIFVTIEQPRGSVDDGIMYCSPCCRTITV